MESIAESCTAQPRKQGFGKWPKPQSGCLLLESLIGLDHFMAAGFRRLELEWPRPFVIAIARLLLRNEQCKIRLRLDKAVQPP